MAAQLERFAPLTPSDDDRALAVESIRRLASLMQRPHKLTVHVQADVGPSEQVVLPSVVSQLLPTILAETAQGNAVTACSVHAELTTQEAAGLLNVSRPHLIGLLDKGEIPHHKVGTHRRVMLRDLVEYKHKVDARRDAALKELAALGQELDSDD